MTDRASQIDQVGREIAEAALAAGWLEGVIEGRWGAEDWEWTDADYDWAKSGLGGLEPGELGQIRDAAVAHLQGAVDAAEPAPRKRYRVQVAVKGGGCDAIVAGLAEALRVAELCGAPWWIECDDQYFLYQTEEAMDAGSLEVGVVEKVTRDALRAILAGFIVLAAYGLVGASDVEQERLQAAREAAWPVPVEGDIEDF